MADIERENYYILLELEYDPPVTDPARIKSALRDKKQEWTRWQDNPGKRNTGLNYLGRASEIERVLLDPVLREQEAQAARALRIEMLRQFEAELRVLESKGHILPREAAAIAVKYKAYGVGADTVEKYAKCPVRETPPPLRLDDNGEILDRVTARTIQRNLSLLGYSTLYAFLEEMPYSSVKKLTAAAEQKRRLAASGARSPEATIAQELAGICIPLFETIQSKEKYDRYLKISKYPAVNELVDEEFARSQYISPQVLLRIAGFAVEKYGIKVLEAEEYIKNYCAAYDVPLNDAGLTIICPACTNKTLRDGLACTSCGQPVNGTCPACGSAFEYGPAMCGACGFSVGEMAKGLRHLGEAENALIEGNWSNARRNLQYVKKYWPGHAKLEVLEKRTLLLEERYAQYMESINDSIAHRQFYAAQELIAEATARHMRLPAAMTEQVEKTIADFESRVRQIQTSQAPPKIEELLRLLEDVADSMELSRMFTLYPPGAPEKIVTGVTGRHVRLTWSACESTVPVTYLIVRKQGGAPLTAFDGDILYEGAGNSFLDKTVPPLTETYYSVFSKRAGTYSRTGTTTEPVLVLLELEGLRILPVDGGAQLSWDFNPFIRDVKIWRKLGGEAPVQPGEGILLENDRLDGFSDTKLKNDVEYWYYLAAIYVIDGRRVISRGICDSVVPHKTIAPIDELVIAPTDSGDSEYIVNWNTAQHESVLLFCATKKPPFRSGDILSIEELVANYRKLDLEYKHVDSAQFRLGISGGVYLFAAAVFGRFATVGEPRYLINVAEMNNVTCDVIGGKIYLNMKWPAGVNEVAVVYRFDRHPKRPDEAGATKLLCTREQYDLDAAVLIKEPEPGVYYMTIYAAFTAPDGGKVYSKGVQFTVNNQPQQEIFYTFAYRKKMFSESGVLDVTVSSPEALVLPKAVIVGKIGRLPLKRSDGLPLFEIEREMRISGSISFQFNTTLLPQDIYIRLFFHNDAMYEKFRLIPTSKMKIT